MNGDDSEGEESDPPSPPPEEVSLLVDDVCDSCIRTQKSKKKQQKESEDITPRVERRRRSLDRGRPTLSSGSDDDHPYRARLIPQPIVLDLPSSPLQVR